MTASAAGEDLPGQPGMPELAGLEPPRALYVHFPFCVHRCHYCDFSVTRAADPPVGEWLGQLESELSWWFRRARWDPPLPLDTVFVGGGTPSLAGKAGAAGLAAMLDRWFRPVETGLEWSVEANPASLDPAVAAAWLDAGATRISVGVQAMDDGALAWLGRLHDRADAAAAVRVAREAGFRSISADLLFGLPTEVGRDLGAEVDALLDLGVDHVSAYGLTIEPRTPLARRVELGRVTPTTPERYEIEYRLLADRFTAAGLVHYEVSSFARPGHECRHNWYYWNRSPYLGIGPSAHGFFPPLRVWNVFRWDRYRDAIRSGVGPLEGSERLGPEDEWLERVWLGLRTREGIPQVRAEGAETLRRRLAAFADAGWIREEQGRLRATVDGWLRLDELVAEIGALPESGAA